MANGRKFFKIVKVVAMTLLNIILSLFSILDFHSQGQGRKSDQNVPSVTVPQSHEFAPPFATIRLMP
jgi:hypothetical protein